MAVTGKGTETNPWIVSTIEEIAEYFGKDTNDESGTEIYLKLKDNTVIDCNRKGASWEWETIRPNGHAGKVYFNLNGGTIKNMIVAANNYLFWSQSSRDIKIYSDVEGGKILNIFANRARGFFQGYGTITLENISVSCNSSGVTEFAFINVDIINSSVYVKSSKIGDYTGGMYRCVIKAKSAKNSDFWFDIDDMNGGMLIGTSSDYDVADCRFRGSVKGIVNPSSFIAHRRIQNCVVSMSSEQTVTYLAGNSSTGSTGVYNSTLLNNYNLAHNSGLLAANENQIKNGEWLNNNGFICVQE